ncbi:MAG: hypothetical protein EBS84_22300 [Proteobacteria bacterium]|nr:hypothetical protein [Pseudomonadota bacterium]
MFDIFPKHLMILTEFHLELTVLLSMKHHNHLIYIHILKILFHKFDIDLMKIMILLEKHTN